MPLIHPSTTAFHLALRTVSLLLIVPTPLLFFLSLYALLVAGITSPFILLWPYLISSAITVYILSLERHALDTRTLNQRRYGRFQFYRLGGMLVAYLPFLVASMFSRGLRTMMAQVMGYNAFWITIEWLNVLNWLFMLASALYTPFYQTLHQPSLPTNRSDISLPIDHEELGAFHDEIEEEDMPLPTAGARLRSDESGRRLL